MQIAYFWHVTKSIIFRVLIDFLHLPFLQFAFASLIILNGLMDLWICFKICVILYWAFISEEWRIVHQKKYLNRRPPSFNQIYFSQIHFTFVSNKIDSWKPFVKRKTGFSPTSAHGYIRDFWFFQHISDPRNIT